MYAIIATWIRPNPGTYIGSGQVPTFYLSERVQGIVSEEHAKRIALDVLSAGTLPTDEMIFSITARHEPDTI